MIIIKIHRIILIVIERILKTEITITIIINLIKGHSVEYATFAEKRGHIAKNCWENKNNNNNNDNNKNSAAMTSVEVDTNEAVAFVATDISLNCNDCERWLLDSGASNHMTNNKSGLYDYSESNKQVKIGDGSHMNVEGIGKLDILVVDATGKERTVTLMNVRFVPGLTYNLLSLGRMLENRLNITYENKRMLIGNNKIKFEITGRIKTDGADLFVLNAARSEDKAHLTIDAQVLHEQLGHPNIKSTITMAKNYG